MIDGIPNPEMAKFLARNRPTLYTAYTSPYCAWLAAGAYMWWLDQCTAPARIWTELALQTMVAPQPTVGRAKNAP